MKKKFFQLTLTFSLLLFTFLIFAQDPPNPPSGHGSGDNQPVGDGAPIAGGLGILLALGAAYGGRKAYKAWKDKDELEE